MTDSASESGSGPAQINENNNNCSKRRVPEIPIEIVSDEEMALLEAALASARSCVASSAQSLSHFQRNVRSVQSIAALSKRGFPASKEHLDMEDFGSTRKKTRLPVSFLHQFRKKRGLSVTDITSSEWCEKQMEFNLLGKRRVNKAMEIGIARHAKLEEEVIKKSTVRVESDEDRWALKLFNSISGVNQLLFEGLTRELPLISYVEGVWLVGVIDEIRMPGTETGGNPLLVDMKTRVQPTLPSEPQQRNGRLQLMCYKHMWDNLVADNFPTRKFFDYFSLNPYDILFEDSIQLTANLGFPVKTLEDVVRLYRNTCSMLPPAQNQLLLRYECQQDNSVLGEYQFAYDFDWLKKQINVSLEFWRGEREASYTPEEERWKCRCCQFASLCPINANLETSSTSSPTNSTPDDKPIS